MNIVVVQKIHFACWFVASLCVCTLDNLNVEPALWLQCSVVERLNHTASGSLLKLFLISHPWPVLESVVYRHWAGFSVHDTEGILLGGGGRSKMSPVSVNWIMTVLILISLILHGTALILLWEILFPFLQRFTHLLSYFTIVWINNRSLCHQWRLPLVCCGTLLCTLWPHVTV